MLINVLKLIALSSNLYSFLFIYFLLNVFLVSLLVIFFSMFYDIVWLVISLKKTTSSQNSEKSMWHTKGFAL